MTEAPHGWATHGGGDARSARFSAQAALRHGMLWASRRQGIKRAVVAAPITRGVVARFVAGETVDDVVAVVRTLDSNGLRATVDHLGEDTRDATAATAVVNVYRWLAARLEDAGLAAGSEMSLKLSALGQALDESMALDNARAVCDAARAAGTMVTVDMEDHTTTDSTLRIVETLREDFPSTGAVIQASLHRSEDDCRRLAVPGSRVRLCKGAYQEPASLAWQRRDDVRFAFLRCLRLLVDGGAHAMVATHDPLLITGGDRIFRDSGTAAAMREYQMLYGIRPEEQRRLAAAGETVRVYVPFGQQWYGYLMRRMAERPANLALVMRALRSRR